MKKTLLIATILSYSSFSLPANAYKNSIYLDNPDTLNSIFAKNFTLAQNNSLNNSGGSGGSGNSGGSEDRKRPRLTGVQTRALPLFRSSSLTRPTRSS